MLNAIILRNLWFQSIFDLIWHFRSEYYPHIEDLIIVDVTSEISRAMIVEEEGYFLALTHRRQTASCNRFNLKKFTPFPSEQRQYPLMKRLTARTEHWDDRCDHYQKYFLYLSSITVSLWFSLSWVRERRSLGSYRSNFCGMELQLAARVSIHTLKPNKRHVHPCFMVYSRKMTVCVSTSHPWRIHIVRTS